MADSALAEQLGAERAAATRALLAAPLLDASAEPYSFRLVARHASWLVDYFEQSCGWSLTVDAAGGFARLAKRAVSADVPARPLLRPRGQGDPFDRRRYQLLCLVCAQMVRHPVTTVGLLASAVTAEAALDTSRHGERSAFVDALRVLIRWGALQVTAGDIDAFVDSAQANAFLTADTARLHRLLVSATAASSMPDTLGVDEAVERLRDEPRYHGEPEAMTAEARNRWARHRLGRRVLDNPVVYVEDLAPAEGDYLASLSGRRWLRERAADAGLELEERAEGFLAADPQGEATDLTFPAPHGNVHQVALLLADRLVIAQPDGRRRLAALHPAELRDEVERILARYPGWARTWREAEGADRLAAAAIDLLASFDLVRRETDGTVRAMPALARYRVGDVVLATAGTLFEEDE